MPSPNPSLTLAAARDHLVERCFGEGSDATSVGIEVEWLTVPTRNTPAVSLRVLEAAAEDTSPLPGDSRVTLEPGGQLELSSTCHPDVGTACVATVVDTTVMAQRLALDGVALAGLGIDPGPLRPRLVRSARYDAMERFFDRRGVAGRTMMRSTAAMQLNLDCGDATTAALRWRRAHVLGPTLAATFANSPITDDLVTGWRSARLATWWAIDPTRTQPPPMEGDPVACWADYVLDAHVMLVRGGDSFVGLEDDITFAEWVTHGHELGYPDLADLDYHLTTLFPPVRARGWFELRMIDALPDPWWRAAAGVTTALLYDEHAGAAAEEAAAPTAGMWVDAARHGLSHPALARSAKRCFALALDALPRVGADPTTQTAALRYFERFVAAGRCPADEVLTAWTADRARPLTDAMVVT